MKLFAFTFAILLAGVTAVPKLRLSPELLTFKNDVMNERFVDGIVADAIADISQQIRDAGLDPLNIESLSTTYRLPVTNLVNVEATLENVQSNGLSNIIISNISFGLLTLRLQFNIYLPRIAFSIGKADLAAEILGLNFDAGVSGDFAIVEPRVEGDVRVSIGVISGISIRSLSIDFSLGGLESDLNVNILGNDYSDTINQFVGDTLPTAISDNRAEINELIEYIAWLVLDE